MIGCASLKLYKIIWKILYSEGERDGHTFYFSEYFSVFLKINFFIGRVEWGKTPPLKDCAIYFL